MRFVSFFSGALGLDLGLERAGFECLAVNENNKRACETIRRNRPKTRLYDRDIRDLDENGILSDLKLRKGELELVVGGPPCQAFSTAGRRRSLMDDRGSVALHFLDLALGLRPRWIVIENVRGLLSAPLCHRPHDERGEGHAPLERDEMPGGALAQVLAVLERDGYAPTFQLYDAANFGVPQRRERLIIIAGRDGEKADYLAPTHVQDRWRTFRGSVAGLEGPQEHVPLRKGQAKFLSRLEQGQNWRDLPLKLQKEALGKAFFSSGGRVGFCRRVAWDSPTPTLVTNPTMPATLLAHPVEMRPLSVEEYKRVQGFPDEWELAGPTIQKYRQLGNAVPVGLAERLGVHLLAEGTRTSVPLSTSRYRHTSDTDWRLRHAHMVTSTQA